FAGGLTVIFQLLLIVSGNFSWLNYLSIVISISCFRNQDLAFLGLKPAELIAYRGHEIAVYLLAFTVIALSVKPALNLLSDRQMMTASFEPLHIVNTYGAFGSITRVRREIIIEGAMEDSDTAEWKAYEFKAKPGDLKRIPPLVAPYHLRLDWLMW